MKINRKPNGGIGVAQSNQKRRLSSAPQLNIVFPDRHLAPFSVSFSISWLQNEQDSLLSQLIPLNSHSRTPATLVLPAAPPLSDPDKRGF